MRVLLDPTVNNFTDVASAPPSSSSGPRVPTRPAPSRKEVIKEAQQSAAPAEILQANVTFRRDAAGRLYYVVTDAQSGKELREFPPEEVRKVGEGIAEYLKREEAKATSHLEVKA